MIQPVQEIKALGKYKVKIYLHSAVDAEITIEVKNQMRQFNNYTISSTVIFSNILKIFSCRLLIWKII